MTTQCEFLNPVLFDGTLPTSSKDYWQFKNSVCSSSLPVYLSEVQSTSSPEKVFYLSNTIDLGQILILGFCVLVLVFAILWGEKQLFFRKPF